MTATPEAPDAEARAGAASRSLLDGLFEGCQIVDRAWRYRYLNDAAVRQSRLAREQLLGRTMMEAFPGIENTPLFASLRACMESRTLQRLENEFTYPDGATAWFDLRCEPVPGGVLILSLEITADKRAAQEQALLLDVLQALNSPAEWEQVLRAVLAQLKAWSGCEAVGLRLREGEDFPYFETSGFSGDFVRAENKLCSYDETGALLRDASGQPAIACMCGNILCGRFDPSKSFFTADGCFWSACTTDLLARTTDADRQARTRNRCNGEGYETVALIPLRAAGETFGLLQFNDRRKNRLSRDQVALLRRVADHAAAYLAKVKADVRVSHLTKVLLGIRNVNQLITRERDRDRLVQRACEMLVEARGFSSVYVGLTEPARRVVKHAFAGKKLCAVTALLESGAAPACASEALDGRRITLRKPHDPACQGCPGAREPSRNHTTLTAPLEQEGRCYGFLLACLPSEVGDIPEEIDLLQEIAGDLGFALRSLEAESDRDRSSAALAATTEQLRQAQKLEAVGRLAGGVAHDFNNILAAQLGYCELMRESLRDPDPLAEDLAQIKACAERAATLTRQLLAFSRKQTMQPEVLDLNATVANVESMLRRLIGEDIEVSLALADGLWRVKADPGQIEQVVMNLAVNARDAMPEGGRLTLETANVTLDDEYVRSHVEAAAGPHVMLAVSDTGCGMSKETFARLFEPFFTTKDKGKGTGLGLATVYGIVKQSNGSIWVYSEAGRGSTFKIYLPRVSAEPEQPAAPRAAKPERGAGELVLLVEDEPPLRGLFARMLKELGYRVRAAGNGGEALLAIEEEGLRPDLLITDVVMPGMSGRVLAERLLRARPGLRVLYTSGYTDNAIVHHGVLDPGTPFLQKPFTLAALGVKIRGVLA